MSIASIPIPCYPLQTGSSEDPCSELYHGPFAASEPEVQAITNYIQSNSPVVGAIDFHSYYQEILYPPGTALTKFPALISAQNYSI